MNMQMKRFSGLFIMPLWICFTGFLTGNAQGLNHKQENIIAISALTAKGNMPSLQVAFNTGLDSGLTVNEIKEILIQLYAYCGFPRSLNAINTFNTVLTERKVKGKVDPIGAEPVSTDLGANNYQAGKKILEQLTGRTEGDTKTSYAVFVPVIDSFLKEHLFADIFSRGVLTYQERELVTVSALFSLGGVDSQLRGHLSVAMYNDVTAAQLTSLVSIIYSAVGLKEGNDANEKLQTFLNRNQNNTVIEKGIPGNSISARQNKEDCTIFPKGEKITNDNFFGNAWLQQIIMADTLNPTQVGSVTFEPVARTKWHLHPAGQILLITSGTGYYQEKGVPKRIIKKGDTIKCPANVPHWHGASKDDELIQIAITNTTKGAVVWLGTVTDEEYNK